MSTPAPQHLAMLREIGDLAWEIALEGLAAAPWDYAWLRGAEDDAHESGIARNDIDSARISGLLDPNWPRLRSAADLFSELRTALPRAAHGEIGRLREMLAAEAVLNRAGQSNVVIAEQIPAFDQHRRNLAAVHAGIGGLAGLLDPRAAATHTLRSRLTADWEQTIAATVGEHGTGPRLDELWSQHAEPDIEHRAQQIITTLRQPEHTSARPRLPSLEELATRAGRAAHIVLCGPTAADTPARGLTAADAIAAALPADADAKSSPGIDAGPAPVEPPSAATETGPQL